MQNTTTNIKTIKREIAEILGVSKSAISVRLGSGSLKHRILVQSNEVNIWKEQDVIAEVLPGFEASSAVMGLAWA